MNIFKKLIDIRSPLWQLLAILLFYPTALLIAYRNDTSDPQHWTVATLMALSLVVFIYVGALGLRTMLHNRKNPSAKINPWSIVPLELKEEDEGMRMITGRATRQTYIYDSAAIPLLALALLFLPHNIYIALTGVVLLSVGHYAVYWRYIWKAL